MSLSYSISIDLIVDYNESVIKNILSVGDQLGYLYREFTYDMSNMHDPAISVDKATEKVLQGLPDDMHSLLVEMDGTYAYLHFIKYPGSLTVMLSGLCVFWSKQFTEGEDLDIGRYAKALIDLVADYKIFEMRIVQD